MIDSCNEHDIKSGYEIYTCIYKIECNIKTVTETSD